VDIAYFRQEVIVVLFIENHSCFMQIINSLGADFQEYLSQYRWKKKPQNLYEPSEYILQLGGKRMRPILVLMATEALGGNRSMAMHAALAVEFFHNFTLVHDDIMDAAPLRRKSPTVHSRWGNNVAILSGDVLFAKSLACLEAYPPHSYKSLTKLLIQTAIEVCEGQQMDMDFEQQKEVLMADYIEMIRLKTAVLVGAAMQMGALVAEKNESVQKQLYDFGIQLGIAFQLQDDYLDTFGDAKTFGKQIGGDILENKKTYLFIKALENAVPEQRAALLALYADNGLFPDKKIREVQEIFVETQAEQFLLEEIKQYTQRALRALKEADLPSGSKEIFEHFAFELMHRRT